MNEATSEYKDTILRYFEEEIMGEAYFYGLRPHFPDPDMRAKLVLLAEVERFAAEAVRPLLAKYNLTPREDSELKPIGESWVEKHDSFCWATLMSEISVYYPKYTEEFRALEAIAPKEDLPPLKILTDHEVVAVDFANLELAKDTNSAAPMQRYLAP